MKLATYKIARRQSFGIVRDDGIIDLPTHWASGPRTLMKLLQAGPGAMGRARKLADSTACDMALASVKLLAPIPQPPKVLGLAVNYAEHHREWDRGHDLPDDPARTTTPRPFLMPATAVIGPGEIIPWPSFSRQIDHEVELAVVIGTRCKDVTADQAAGCIAGYTIANDVSARSCTHADGRTKRPKDDFFDWLHGKWADGFCPMGPCIVTSDEIPDVRNLELALTVNGDKRQSGNTRDMMFDVFQIVSFVSHLMTLVPGDVIATGTPSGVAMATGKWLAAGDVITCRIEKIGELTNTLGLQPASFYTPCK